MVQFTVTNSNDSGAGSLRQALADARDNGAGHDTITFAAGLDGSIIRLQSGPLAVTSGSVTIDGDIDDDGTIDIVISGDSTGNGADIGDSMLLAVSTGATLTLDSLTLTEGFARGEDGDFTSYDGGDAAVITNAGSLTIINSEITNSYVIGGVGYDSSSYSRGGNGGNGAIISNVGILNISDSLFDGNACYGVAAGDGSSNTYEGTAGGVGGHAALVVSSGIADLQNVLAHNNTLAGGIGGDGGFATNGNGGNGGAGGIEALVANSGTLTGEVAGVSNSLSGTNFGGYGGSGIVPGTNAADGASLEGHANYGFAPVSTGFDDHLGDLIVLVTGTGGTTAGSSGNDIIWTRQGSNTINGLGGQDDLAGGAGADIINGGTGDDVVEGGSGDDVLDGGSHGANGDTVSFAGFRSLTSAGISFQLGVTTAQNTGAGLDTITNFENATGSAHDDSLTESDVRNALRAGQGDDVLVLRIAGVDELREVFDGGAGEDTMVVQASGNQTKDLRNDTVLSIETLDLQQSLSGATAGLELLAKQFAAGRVSQTALIRGDTDAATFEHVFVEMGSISTLDLSDLRFAGNRESMLFVFDGDASAENITGTDINDQINGADGGDILSGGFGADTLNGDAGDDTLIGGTGDDTLNGGDGNDSLEGNSSSDILRGDDGEDELLGGSGTDRLFGGNDADTLDGGAGVDRLDGGKGNDKLSGGVDTVRDFFTFRDGYAQDHIDQFDQAGTDLLRLDDSLWLATFGVLTAADVVTQFGSIDAGGTLITLDFGNGDILSVENTAGLNLATLHLDIDIV